MMNKWWMRTWRRTWDTGQKIGWLAALPVHQRKHWFKLPNHKLAWMNDIQLALLKRKAFFLPGKANFEWMPKCELQFGFSNCAIWFTNSGKSSAHDAFTSKDDCQSKCGAQDDQQNLSQNALTKSHSLTGWCLHRHYKLCHNLSQTTKKLFHAISLQSDHFIILSFLARCQHRPSQRGGSGNSTNIWRHPSKLNFSVRRDSTWTLYHCQKSTPSSKVF